MTPNIDVVQVGLLLATIFATIVTIILTYLTWRKTRVVYGIEKVRFFDEGSPEDNKELTRKLNSGEYFILTVLDTKSSSGKGIEMILARVKRRRCL